MQWEFINAMTFESATHRIRRMHTHLEAYWLAERKAGEHGHAEKLNGHFPDRPAAETACERDQYSLSSGR